jgi:hypothetical protein
MHLNDDRSAPTAWIPWILALAALFGWSSLAPDCLTLGKSKRQEDCGLVQMADDLPASGLSLHPLAGLVPGSGGAGRLPGLSATILRIKVASKTPVIRLRDGGIQGRAPPVRA